MIHLDSSFLIDLLREIVRERPGPAFDAIESIDDDEVLGVSVLVACEIRAGAELSRPDVERIRMNLNSTAFNWDMLGSAQYVGDLAKRLPAREVNRPTG